MSFDVGQLFSTVSQKITAITNDTESLLTHTDANNTEGLLKLQFQMMLYTNQVGILSSVLKSVNDTLKGVIAKIA